MDVLTRLEPLHIPHRQGRPLNVLGQHIHILASSAETGGGCAFFEDTSPPYGGPPLHIHHREDETFRVLEGRFEFRCGERTFIGEEGDTIFLPRNIPHAFKNLRDRPSRMLIALTPGGFEGFFEEVDRLTAAGALTAEALERVGAQFGLEFRP